MLVIHPHDRSTAFLSALYEGAEDLTVITNNISRKDLNHLLHHTPRNERIMLLGHGCSKGLYWREDDTQLEFDSIIVGHPHAFHLRSHSNIIAVFCHADAFAEAEGLHGLFTGMIISEMSEANEYGVVTTENELARENQKFVTRLRTLLAAGVPLSAIPKMMQAQDDTHSPLTEFNYSRVRYIYNMRRG